MRIKTFLIFMFLLYSTTMWGQELNARLTINTSQVRGVDADLVRDLEQSVNTLLNEQRWTEASVARSERIDCIVVITIKELKASHGFKAEIQITSRRPVYNSSYMSPSFNFKDSELEFNYTQGESLNYNEHSISNTLVATIAYYAYIIIGLDFDSFSPHGGRMYFDKAMAIANTAQSMNTPGWEPFSGKVNRYDLAVALTEESSKDFHSMWYNYHRMGLDVMESDAIRGRLRILEAVKDLGKIQEARPNSGLLTMFSDTKLDELIDIATEATSSEKEELKKLLLRLMPARSSRIRELK